jgi:hypothetical protein
MRMRNHKLTDSFSKIQAKIGRNKITNDFDKMYYACEMGG